MKKYSCLIFFFFWIFSPACFAWNNTGHEIIAEIAFNQLSDRTKDNLAQLLVNHHYPNELHHEFLLASTWPDYIKGQDIHAFDHWHYINLPFSLDSTPLPIVAKENVVWAINQSIDVLKSDRAPANQKKMFVKFLVHFIGDVHQPLHAANLISKQFFSGDNGGNLYLLASNQYQSLHVFWDDAGGLFSNYYPYHKLRDKEIKQIADSIERDYPETSFGNTVNDLNPMDAAKESLNLAKSFIYSIPINTSPSVQYIKQSQKIAEKQIALAGYRLANVLNLIFGKSPTL